MTEVERLAEFVVRASYDDLSEAARDQLKIRVLDSLGCAIGAMSGEPVQLVHDQVRMGQAWEDGTLPFCAWGCAILSCVKCDATEQVFTFENARLWPQEYSLDGFFEMWLNGTDILAHDPGVELADLTLTNPFTRREQTTKIRRRRES